MFINNKRDLLHTGIVRKNIFVLLLSVHSKINFDVRNKYVYRKHEILIFCVTIKISCFMILTYIFPANSKITSYRHILLDGNDHYNSNSLKTLSVNRTFINFFQYLKKSARKSKSKGRVLKGLRVSFTNVNFLVCNCCFPIEFAARFVTGGESRALQNPVPD